MIVVVCSSFECMAVFRAMGDPLELHPLVGIDSMFWPDKYTCPACGANAAGVLEQNIDLRGRQVRDLEVQELFQALNGMGLPEEQNCTLSVVSNLFLEHRVVKVVGHEVSNTRRFCVEWLELDDGTRMYFAASSHGSVVYRITRPIKHTEKVLEESSVES